MMTRLAGRVTVPSTPGRRSLLSLLSPPASYSTNHTIIVDTVAMTAITYNQISPHHERV